MSIAMLHILRRIAFEKAAESLNALDGQLTKEQYEFHTTAVDKFITLIQSNLDDRRKLHNEVLSTTKETGVA